MVLDVGVGFSPPVGILRNFVQSDVVNQEVGVGVRTNDVELSFCDFCKTFIVYAITVTSGGSCWCYLLLLQCSFGVVVII